MSSEGELLVEIKWEDLHSFINQVPEEDQPKLCSMKALLKLSESVEIDNRMKRRFYVHRNPDVRMIVSVLTFRSEIPGKCLINQMIKLYCRDCDGEELHNSLLKTELIDFNIYTIFHNVDTVSTPHIRRAMESRNGLVHSFCDTIVMELCIEKALNFELRCPEGVCVRPLKREEAGIPYEAWKYNRFQSLEHFEAQVSSMPSAGLFQDNRLVSWILVNDAGEMAFFHTVQSHRRGGYGKLALQFLCLQLATMNVTPLATIENDNEASLSCFRSLGFQRCFEGSVLFYTPVDQPLLHEQLEHENKE